MNTRLALFPVLRLLVAAVLLSDAAAANDLLDIRAVSLSPVGPVHPSANWGQPLSATHALRCLADHKTILLREGESIGLLCTWSTDIVNANTCWSMDTKWDNKWSGHFTYAGVKFHDFTVTIPYGTALGSCTKGTGLGSPCFPDFWNTCSSSITSHYPKSIPGSEFIQGGWGIGFTGNKLGLHTVTCAVDEPKSFSDRDASNNKAYLRIKVVPKGARLNLSLYQHCTNEVAVGGVVSLQ